MGVEASGDVPERLLNQPQGSRR